MNSIAAELPDLSHLSRTNLIDRVLNMAFGMGAYPEPIAFQLTTGARLLDKALDEWSAARDELAQHAGVRQDMPPILASRPPGVTRALFRAIGHLETTVDSLDRALRFLEVLEIAPELRDFAGMSLPTAEARGEIRLFRNRITHGDDDIAKGKGGQGRATGTLRPDATGMELQGLRLEFDGLAETLDQIHDYLRAASEKV